MPIKAVVLGLGRSGWRQHCKAINAHPQFDLVGVVDAVPERLKEARETYGCETDSDVSTLLERVKPDLVTVALPSHLHAPVAIEALEAGCHVVVEKPMARSYAEASSMVDVAKRSGRILTIYQSARLSPAFRGLQEVLASGRIGRPVLVKMRGQNFNRRRDWQMLRSRGGGTLYNTGPHYVDQALVLLGGRPDQAFCDMQHTIGAGDADDHVKILLKRDGLTVDIELSNCAVFSDPSLTVYGHTGGIQANKDHLYVKWYDCSEMPPPQLYDGPAVNRQYDRPEAFPWQEDEVPLPTGVPGELYYERLAACILDGKPLFVKPEEVLVQMELFDRFKQLNGLQ